MTTITKDQKERRIFLPEERYIYSLLTECGFVVKQTGGGCTAWVLEFPNADVFLTQDSDHIFEPEYMDYCGVSVGVYADCSPIWDNGTTEYREIPALVCQAMAIALNYRPEEGEE